MTDNKFSNQKSALEDYFISLLDEVDSDLSVPEKDTPQPAQLIEDESKKADNHAGIKASQPVVEVEEPKDVSQRPSIADMLAKVSIEEQEKDKETDFAEPVPELRIPMPAVAEQPETKVESLVEIEEQVVVKLKEEIVVEVEEKQEADVIETQALKQEVTTESAPSVVIQKTEPPEWAESAFQCLLFQVGGLSLAVPLITLNAVIPWPENVVETPNQTDWYLGVLMNHGNKVQVIDTAVMVLPEEHRKGMAAEPADRLSHILLVDDQRWGLACDSIGEVVWLKKEDVKWRSNTTKRPWLLGTAIDHMCAVMDTTAFADMLASEK